MHHFGDRRPKSTLIRLCRLDNAAALSQLEIELKRLWWINYGPLRKHHDETYRSHTDHDAQCMRSASWRSSTCVRGAGSGRAVSRPLGDGQADRSAIASRPTVPRARRARAPPAPAADLPGAAGAGGPVLGAVPTMSIAPARAPSSGSPTQDLAGLVERVTRSPPLSRRVHTVIARWYDLGGTCDPCIAR